MEVLIELEEGVQIVEGQDKLSAAIRRGCQYHEQGFGGLFALRGGKIFTCALGAAYEGFMGEQKEILYPGQVYGFLFERVKIGGEIARQIIQMNDCEELSREEIAAWLEEQGL